MYSFVRFSQGFQASIDADLAMNGTTVDKWHIQRNLTLLALLALRCDFKFSCSYLCVGTLQTDTPQLSFRTATKVCVLLPFIYLSVKAADTDYSIVYLGTPTHTLLALPLKLSQFSVPSSLRGKAYITRHLF